jgi:ATP-dependent RNA helicase DDX6/DHH1
MDRKIAEAEAGIERYDAAIRGAETEHETATEYSRGVSMKVANAQGEKGDMQSRLDEKMNERHDLQVLSITPTISSLPDHHI